MAQHRCPVCHAEVVDTISLFITESEDVKEDVQDGAVDSSETPLDVNALLTRIFHFQRRNLMHQRQILESKIELKTVQATLAAVHQNRSELERCYDFAASAPDMELVRNVGQGDMLGLIVGTHDEVEQLRKNISRARAINNAARRNLASIKAELRTEGVRLPVVESSSVHHDCAPGPSPGGAVIRAAKRSREINLDVIDVDASSEEDDTDCCMQMPTAQKGPGGADNDVEVIVRETVVRDEDDLPPLFPSRNPHVVPQMGLSFGRSLRDLPRPTDALVQRTLR